MIDEIKKILTPITSESLKLRNFGNFILSKHFSYYTNNVYSYISNDNISFEQSLANVGKMVFVKNINENIFSENQNISIQNIPFDKINPQYDFEKNFHLRDNNIIAKIDLGGYEYDFFKKYQKAIIRFSQITVQFCDITNSFSENKILNSISEQDRWQKKIDTFNYMNSYYNIINISPNNKYTVKNEMPDVLKITYLRKDMCGLLNTNLFQPNYPSRDIDIPEDSTLPDIKINWWN